MLRLGSGVITVAVGEGEKQKEFAVHEALITERSRFFRNAIQGNWKEAEERIVNLTEDHPDVFELYLQALYAGHVELPDGHATDTFYNMLGGVFVLAERIRDVKTKNLIVEEIKAKADIREHFAAYLQMAAVIYNGTPGPCGIRRLLVDLVARSNDYHAAQEGIEKFTAKLEGVPKQFLMDLVFGLYTKRQTNSRSGWNSFKSESAATYMEDESTSQ